MANVRLEEGSIPPSRRGLGGRSSFGNPAAGAKKAAISIVKKKPAPKAPVLRRVTKPVAKKVAPAAKAGPKKLAGRLEPGMPAPTGKLPGRLEPGMPAPTEKLPGKLEPGMPAPKKPAKENRTGPRPSPAGPKKLAGKVDVPRIPSIGEAHGDGIYRRPDGSIIEVRGGVPGPYRGGVL